MANKKSGTHRIFVFADSCIKSASGSIRTRWASGFALALAATACGGGTGPGGEFDESSEPAQKSRNSLVDAAEAALASRRAEVDDHMARWHAAAGHRVVDTVTEDYGNGIVDVVDLVAADSVPGSQGSPPPPAFQPAPGELHFTDQPLRKGAGDPSLVRFVRPSFERYVDGSSRADSLARYMAEIPLGIPPTGTAPGAPCTNNCQRLYAASRQNTANLGIRSSVNANWGPGEIASSTFFLAQTNVSDLSVNINTAAEWIGWIIGRNPFLNGLAARLYTEFFTAGINNTGNYIGGWAGPGRNLGFVPLAGAWIAVEDQVPWGLSTVGGNQIAHVMFIEYYSTAQWNCGSGCTGSWWLGMDGGWVGHYNVGASAPNVNFNRITSSAPTLDWYGEVYDPSPATWTATDMGSPQYASASSTWQQAGFFRHLQYRRTSDGSLINSTGAQVLNVGGDDPNCYSRYEQTFTDPNWTTTMWFGGPGRTSTNGCDPF